MRLKAHSAARAHREAPEPPELPEPPEPPEPRDTHGGTAARRPRPRKSTAFHRLPSLDKHELHRLVVALSCEQFSHQLAAHSLLTSANLHLQTGTPGQPG